MFEIKTYILLPKQLNEKIEGRLYYANGRKFIDVFNISRIKMYRDRLKHLDGFIFISHYDLVLSDHEHFDDIFEMWLIILQMIKNTMDDGEGKAYLPSQPTEISMKAVSRKYWVFSLDNGKYTVPSREFCQKLLEGAEQFYKKVTFDLTYLGMDIASFNGYMKDITEIKDELTNYLLNK